VKKVNKKGKLLIFSAPSGSGKTTLVHYLIEQIPQLAFSVSATSRPPRPGEENGKDYFFLGIDDFKKKIEENAFVEWEEVYENQFYGSLKSEVERLRNEGQTVVFDVDVKGGLNIKKQFGGEALAVFVKPPSIKVLEERLRARSTEDEASLKKRISRASYELTFEPQFDAVIVNDQLEQAKQQSLRLVRSFLEKD
jgi:guanylate kinase